jgi:hypothetical protein
MLSSDERIRTIRALGDPSPWIGSKARMPEPEEVRGRRAY